MGKVLGTFKMSVKENLFAAVEYKRDDLRYGKIIFSQRPIEGTVDMLEGTRDAPGEYYLQVQRNTVGVGIERHTFFFNEDKVAGELVAFGPIDPTTTLCFGPCPPYLLDCNAGNATCADGDLTCG